MVTPPAGAGWPRVKVDVTVCPTVSGVEDALRAKAGALTLKLALVTGVKPGEDAERTKPLPGVAIESEGKEATPLLKVAAAVPDSTPLPAARATVTDPLTVGTMAPEGFSAATCTAGVRELPAGVEVGCARKTR